MVLKTCSLFTSKIYQPKIKWKHGGLYFYKNQKYRRLQIDEKYFFCFFYFRNSNFTFPITEKLKKKIGISYMEYTFCTLHQNSTTFNGNLSSSFFLRTSINFSKLIFWYSLRQFMVYLNSCDEDIYGWLQSQMVRLVLGVSQTSKIADLVTFTEEVLNGELYFLCSSDKTSTKVSI